MYCVSGVSVKTHKPQAFVPNEATRNDTNYRMKFAFLSKETVPDYRPLDVSSSVTESIFVAEQLIDQTFVCLW